jgi:hypothetical protein
MAAETYETRALKLLAEALIKEEDRRAKIILNGVPVDEYKGHVEFLRGLTFARKLCGEIETDIRKGK